jgi:hypothetical protein
MQLVIGGAFLDIAQDFVSLANLLECRLRTGIFVDVGVELAGLRKARLISSCVAPRSSPKAL